MVEVVTYHSLNTKNPNEKWVGYILLPRDGKQLTVRFSGCDEPSVIEKAQRFWEKHGAPYAAKPVNPDTSEAVPSGGPGRGKSFAGKSWLLNRTTGERLRASDDEVAGYLSRGFVRAGPRSS